MATESQDGKWVTIRGRKVFIKKGEGVVFEKGNKPSTVPLGSMTMEQLNVHKIRLFGEAMKKMASSPAQKPYHDEITNVFTEIEKRKKTSRS